jgi:predicted regulator of Ras-like GTPase activity (Roadblock/LC7/MglB family)
MSFETILQQVLSDCPGALSLALMESDGIAIAQVQSAAGAGEASGADIGAAGVEFSRILGDIAKAAGTLGGGSVRETVVSLDRMTLIFHHVEDDILVVCALAPEANFGKARYLIRRSVQEIRQEL